jgi:NAD(P)-dependent dehydrogenase (short-subunit alcohol dehydrogenase family)
MLSLTTSTELIMTRDTVQRMLQHAAGNSSLDGIRFAAARLFVANRATVAIAGRSEQTLRCASAEQRTEQGRHSARPQTCRYFARKLPF